MNRRERTFFAFAAVLSLALHAVLLYVVLYLPISMSGRQLFAAALPPEPPSIQITRDSKDLYLEQEPLDELLDPDRRAARAAEQVLDTAKELIDQVEPLEAAPPVQAAEPPKATDPRVAPKLPATQPAPLGGPNSFDATRQLLALAQPAVRLPQFVAPIDAPTVTLPDTASGFGEFDPSKLDALLASGGPGGAGRPGASRSGAGAARAVEPPPAPPPPAPVVAKATPAPPVPPLAEKTIVPVLPPQDQVAVHLDDDFDYTLITYVDPPKRGLFGGGGESEDGYFEVRLQPRRSLRRLKPLKKDVVYAIDTSESITSKWIEPVKRGVAMALDSLNEGDRFNIVMFKDQVSVLAPDGLLAATPQNIAAGREFLNSAEASGFTDVNRALGRLLVRSVPPDRVYQIVLLSDGKPTRGAIDPRSIINLITRENDLVASIYCIGIGDTFNRELLQYVAYRNKGFVTYPPNAWKASESIAELAGRLRYPIVKDAMFTAIGVEGESIFPRIPRDIYQSEPVSLFGRYTRDADKLSMRLTGINGPERLDITFTLDFATADRGSDQVMHNWAFWKLHHLYSETLRDGDTKELHRQIDDLKRKYKIKTAY